MENLYKKLIALQDIYYKNFEAKLVPSIDKEKIIDVRSAQLIKFTKDF